MMQLPAGATGFFEAGTFREPIQRGEFLQLVYQLARESRCTVGETDTSLCGKNFYAAQIVRNSGTEILFMNAYTGHLACSDCWEAQPLRFTAPSAMLAALLPPNQLLSPLVAGTIHRCGAAGCTGSGRARAAALLATQHDRGNSV